MQHVAAMHNGYMISTDPDRIDLVAVHAYLTRAYWSVGIPISTVRRAAAHSLCFGMYRDGEQVGYARAITDRATFAYLADVYVLEAHRGQGLGKWLIEQVLAHPDLLDLRRFMLVTRDATGLYARYGFQSPVDPSGIMQIRRSDPYANEQRTARTTTLADSRVNSRDDG